MPSPPTSRSPSAMSPPAVCRVTRPPAGVNPVTSLSSVTVSSPTASNKAPCKAERSATTVGPPIASGGGNSARFRTAPSIRRTSLRVGANPQASTTSATPQLAQRRDRVRRDEQTEAELSHRCGALEDPNAPARPPQGDGGRQAADAGADDDRGPSHRTPSPASSRDSIPDLRLLPQPENLLPPTLASQHPTTNSPPFLANMSRRPNRMPTEDDLPSVLTTSSSLSSASSSTFRSPASSR